MMPQFDLDLLQNPVGKYRCPTAKERKARKQKEKTAHEKRRAALSTVRRWFRPIWVHFSWPASSP